MKRKASMQAVNLLLLILGIFLTSSCIRENSFKWENVKLDKTELQLRKGEKAEIYLLGVPERFRVDWTSTPEGIAGIVASHYESTTSGAEKIKVIVEAQEVGNTTLIANVICPKNVTKQLTLQVVVKK
ncbi:hypothetical protein HMPREF1869_00427 [Bacteroidales bacterium KA00251]|nr:hypothetical protein HMPREF1869_00427 [Bacteroidales bacterium KA00251]